MLGTLRRLLIVLADLLSILCIAHWNFGWKSRQMLTRYAAANAEERAREAHRKLSPGDRV